MLSRLYELLLNRPALVRQVARLLWQVGCLALLAGVIAAAATAILGVATSTTGGANVTFHQLVPGLPTWWIPESASGVVFYLAVMFAAYGLNDLATELQRTLRF